MHQLPYDIPHNLKPNISYIHLLHQLKSGYQSSWYYFSTIFLIASQFGFCLLISLAPIKFYTLDQILQPSQHFPVTCSCIANYIFFAHGLTYQSMNSCIIYFMCSTICQTTCYKFERHLNN